MSLNKDALSEALQCPVCFENFDGRILLCNAGHQICETCKKKITECPQCRSKYTGTRNYMMEEVIALMKNQKIEVKKSKKKSVEKEKKPVVLSPHKAEIMNRRRISPSPVLCKGLIDCEIIGCSTSLPAGRILNHVRYFHKALLYEVRVNDAVFHHKMDIQLRNYRFAMQIAEFGLFFLIVNVKKNNGLRIVTSWIQGTCKNRDARQYYYTLKMNIDDIEAQYSDLAYGKNQRVEYVEERQQCLKFKTTSRNSLIVVDIVMTKSMIPITTQRVVTTTIKKIPIASNSGGLSDGGRGRKNNKKGKKNYRHL